MLDQTLVTIDEFEGLFANFEEDTVPPNHFKDALNIGFGPGIVFSRLGVSDFLTKSDIRRIWAYNIPGEDTRLLILNGSNQIFDSTSLGSPILTVTGMTDFSAVSIFGRAYISPHNGQVGLENEKIYVYDGTDGSFAARAAAGVPPQGFDLTLTAVAQTASGTDIVAPVAPANGVQVLTTSPYIPNIFTKIKFFQTGGAVTAITITVVGFAPSHVAQTVAYVNKITSAGTTTYTTGELWEEITSITISGLVGAGGLFKVETFGTNIGKLELGYHVVGIVYESDSGFLTKPGPENNLSAIRITQKFRALKIEGIPATLPTGMAKTKVVMSKFITRRNYSGNPDPQQYEMFFVPEAFGGEIPEGRTSTVVNIFDADLVNSADYLLDNLSEIPAGVTIFGTSKGRMLIGGEFDSPTTLRGSKGGEPEAVSATDGFVICDPISGEIRNVWEYRDTIYVQKSHATLITQDDNVVLSQWTINVIDRSRGAECHSVGVINGSVTSVDDAIIVCNASGIYAFNGAYPELPLTWKIKEFWDSGSIDVEKFYRCEIAVDPVEKSFLVCFQSDIAVSETGLDEVDQLLYCDFSAGLNWRDVKWSFWQFYNQTGAAYVPETISAAFIGNQNKYRYLITRRNATKIWNTVPDAENLTNDDGQAITSYFETYKYSASQSGAITHLSGFRTKVIGFGDVDLTIIGPNGKPTETPSDLIIPMSSNGNILEKLNFVDDDVSIRWSINALNEWYQISKIWIFGTEIWIEKPSGLEFDLKLGLVSYWDFADSGNLGLDSHGSNNLTNNNAVTRVAGPNLTDFAGQFVAASLQSLSIADNATLDFAATDFTIASWAYFDSFPIGVTDQMNIFDKGDNYSLAYNKGYNPDRLGFYYINGATRDVISSVPTIALSTWYFIVCWYVESTKTLYIQVGDYIYATEVEPVSPLANATQFTIGNRFTTTRYMDGRISHVGIWNRALRDHEREYLYNQGDGRSYGDL